MEILDIAVSNEEMENFLQNVDDTSKMSEQKRPFWPEEPTKCPVKDCDNLYSKFHSFERHWNSVHVQKKLSFQCPCCRSKYWRRNIAVKHVRQKHNLKDVTIQQQMENNTKFIDPGDVKPYKPNHRLRLAKKRKAQEQQHTLVTERADCRDEEIIFDSNGNTLGKTFKRKRTE